MQRAGCTAYVRQLGQLSCVSGQRVGKLSQRRDNLAYARAGRSKRLRRSL